MVICPIHLPPLTLPFLSNSSWHHEMALSGEGELPCSLSWLGEWPLLLRQGLQMVLQDEGSFVLCKEWACLLAALVYNWGQGFTPSDQPFLDQGDPPPPGYPSPSPHFMPMSFHQKVTKWFRSLVCISNPAAHQKPLDKELTQIPESHPRRFWYNRSGWDPASSFIRKHSRYLGCHQATDTCCDTLPDDSLRASQVQRSGCSQVNWKLESQPANAPRTGGYQWWELHMRLRTFWQCWGCLPPTLPTMPLFPLCPLPSTQWQVNAQMEQTSQSKKSSAWGILGFRRTQSNLPPISRLAFDYVDD